MRDRAESLVNYLVLVTIGMVLVWYAPRAFALYAFMVTIGLVIHFLGRLWTLVRISHAVTNAKLTVLSKKVGVSHADYDAVVDEMRRKGPNAWRAFEQDLKNL